MKIKFINKYDTWFQIDEGSVYTESYNETLDTAFIRISQQTTQLTKIESFDVVLLSDESGRMADRYMCVENITEVITCLSPAIYTYEISLFSETKVLEGYLCPNLAITSQFRDGTPTNRSIYWYLDKYLDLYDEKIRVNGDFVNRHHFSQELINRFDAIKCPEMQWNTPTLREVFNDLLMIDDCIVKVQNNEISFIDITEKFNNITDYEYINRIHRTQIAEDYVSELKMNLKNTLQTSTNINNVVSKEEWLFLEPDNDIVINEKSAVLHTKFPIYRIKHLYMCILGRPYHHQTEDDPDAYRSDDDGNYLYIMDLCNAHTEKDVFTYSNMVYEAQEWATLPILISLSDIPDSTNYVNPTWNYKQFRELVKYQNTTLVYTRGGNTIEGFYRVVKKAQYLFEWYTDINLNVYKTSILAGAANETKFNGAKVGSHLINSLYVDSPADDLWNNVLFKIEYETLADVAFQSSKSKRQSNYRVAFDNQTNAYVDAYSQGILEYMKANRLGNKARFINARYEEGTLIKIGDYYEDSIVYQCEYSIYNNHIDINAQATDGYILRDYYTGIRAKVRSWQIMSESEAMLREELKKYYFEFSFVQKDEYTINDGLTTKYFLSPLWDETVKPLRYVACKIDNALARTYTLDLVSRLVGNSLVYTFGFKDNFEVGRRIGFDSCTRSTIDGVFDIVSTGAYGGVLTSMLKYPDSNGEAVKFDWWISDTMDFIVGDNYPEELIKTGFRIPSYNGDWDDGITEFMEHWMRRPFIDISVISPFAMQYNSVNLYKDNKETIKINLQYEICSESENIVFTKRFMETQKGIKLLQNNVLNTDLTVETQELALITLSSSQGEIEQRTDAAYWGHAGLYLYNIEPYKLFKYDSGTDTLTEVSKTLWYIQVLGYDSENHQLTYRIMDNSGINLPVYIQFKVYYSPYELTHYCKIYEGNLSNFDKNNPSIAAAEEVDDSYITIDDLNSGTSKIDIYGVTENANKVYYICDMDDNVLLAVVGKTTIYMNLLRIRSDNVYDENGIIIDTINHV